jgi:hypothetical protein
MTIPVRLNRTERGHRVRFLLPLIHDVGTLAPVEPTPAHGNIRGSSYYQ